MWSEYYVGTVKKWMIRAWGLLIENVECGGN